MSGDCADVLYDTRTVRRGLGAFTFRMKRFFHTVILLILLCSLEARAQMLSGVVVDGATGDSIPMASLMYRTHGVMKAADLDGCFTIARHDGWILSVSSLGYKTAEIPITVRTASHLRIVLHEESEQLSEVVIKEKKHHYSRKDNPAVELMKRVIAARERTRLENHDYYQSIRYQKLSLALNDYRLKDSDSISTKKFKWKEHVEISPYNGKMTMPLSVNETVKQHIYRKDSRKEKDIILGESSTGLNQLLFSGDAINVALKDVFQDIDIYEDYVRLLQYPFVSPIGRTAISFYRYYIEDTVYVDRQKCYHLHFMPNNQQDFGFRGDLYILTDSTLHVKKCSLTIPKKSDVNFVENMHIDQEFSPLINPADSTRTEEWVLTKDDMWAEMKIGKARVLVVRNTRISDYAFEPIQNALFRGKAKTKYLANAHDQTDEFWNKYRIVKLTEKESAVSRFMTQLGQYKGMKVPLLVIRTLIENFVETSPEGKPSKFDFGPMLSTCSWNFVDGFRLRVSGRTTAALNPHWFWKGYYTHGFRSDKNYYSSTVTYSINKKQRSPFEFPQRNISFETTYDVMSPADKFLVNDKDNIFADIRTESVRQMYFYNRQKLTFTYETEYGLNLSTSLKTESNEVAGDLHFIHVDTGREDFKIRTTEWSIGARFCPGQTYINTKQRRWPINLDSPEFYVKHTTGIDGVLGGRYRMNQTEAGIYKRQWLGSFGYIDMHVDAAAQWNKLPFPLLMTPPIDLSYIEQEGTFNMLHNMEFFMDRKVFWAVSWDMNGKIFNRIPLLKKLKLREYIAFKGVWGKLTDKNNPTLAMNNNDHDLYKLPEGSYAIDSSKPYMEVVAGIHNIFKILSVEWVHRLSYNDHPNTKRNGVRFGLHASF